MKQTGMQKSIPDTKWRPTNWEEIQEYLGFIICLDITAAPDQDLYWTLTDYFSQAI